MGYEIEYERVAAKALIDLDRGTAARITRKIDTLAENPRPSGSTKLVGTDAWRIRIGDYRVVYKINDTVLIVTVTRIAHRREVYR